MVLALAKHKHLGLLAFEASQRTPDVVQLTINWYSLPYCE